MRACLPSTRDGSRHDIDWRGPSVMIFCFSLAILFAIGHHLLNICLDGKAVAEISLDQQWISRAVNAMAYMVKMLLVVATGIAYFQFVWQHARRRPLKIADFDSMFGSLDNIFELRHARFWLRRPILMLTVLIIWTLPLIAIVTPGTLSVALEAISEPGTITVQQRDYGKNLYAATIVAENGTVSYGGARSYLKGPATASLIQTEILSVGHHTTNVSYALSFFGPALRCSQAGVEIRNQLAPLISEYQETNKTSLMFDTWLVKPNATSNDVLVDGHLLHDSDSNRNLRMLDQSSPDATRIYYSIAPPKSMQADLKEPIYFIECSLYNASWAVDFDIRSSGEQFLTMELAFQNWMPGWSSISPPLTESNQTDTILDYAGVMETFGAITAGRLELPDDPNVPFEQTSIALETSPILFADATPAPFTDSAMSTLERTLEILFQNITISARYGVLPQQDLRGDTPLLTFSDVEAITSFSRNVYAYHQRDLVVAYTLAVMASALCITLAILAIREMHAVYSNNFSTAIRVSRGLSRLDHVVADERDRSGAEPLPKRVAETYIWVGKEQKMGLGMGRGKVGTDSSTRSNRLGGAWWGKEKGVDLEKAPTMTAPIVAVSQFRGNLKGDWI